MNIVLLLWSGILKIIEIISMITQMFNFTTGHKMIDILSSDKDEIHKLGFYYIFYKESTDAIKHKNWVHIQLKKLEGDKRCMTLYDKKKAI